jgi:multidrug efflux pump subunit AcrA (membrane-fusion protein)
MDSRRVWRWTRRVIGAGALLGLGVAGAIFFFRPVQVTVTSAVRRDIALGIQGVGTVEAKVAVRIAAKITGRLVSVAVDQGDRVRVGQVRATLDRMVQVCRGHLQPVGSGPAAPLGRT